MKKEDCIFCKIANGEIPSKTLYEDGDFRVILDLGPATRGHALILPREHADNLYELPEDTAAKVFVLAKKMATKMTEKLHCDGLNIVQNNGEAAGQTVRHFHMHLIPRYENDGQHILWNPGESTPEELEAINIMRKALNGLKPDEATDRILDMFSHTRNNVEFVNMV